jgi:Uma2 family endonuclease
MKRSTKATERSGPYTVEDFDQMVREDQKADLIDGVIYMASPENTEANELFVWLLWVMSGFASARKLGKCYASRVALRLDVKNSPEPDILFLRAEHLDRVERGGIRGPADLAVEIVSPESVERDYTQKRRQYARFGIPEYWIVDEELPKVTLLRLGAKQKYREVKPQKGALHSEVLTGFWLRPEWLWSPRPDQMDILQKLLTPPA